MPPGTNASPQGSQVVREDGRGGEDLTRDRVSWVGARVRRVLLTRPPRPTGRWAAEWAKPLGLPSCPYVTRWLVQTPVGSLRLHHWVAPDDPRAKHDHPWWFATCVLRGGYRDVGPDGIDHLRAPALRVRAAEHRHTVYPDDDGAWTLMVTGPKRRAWGFWHGGRFHKANRWFVRYGHHPCD